MRECIYCGRQLEKGESCTCAMSVTRRREREAAEAPPKSKKEEKQSDREKKAQEKAQEKQQRKQRRESERQAQRAARAAYQSAAGPGAAGVIKNTWQLIKSFIKSPIETVMNPGRMGKAEIFILVGLEGLISGLCIFSIITGALRGPFSFLGNVLGFRGMSGYGVLLGWALSAVSGTIGGTVIFLTYSGIFFLVNKFIFRGFITYWDFVKRFAFVAVPVALVGMVGIVLGMFSQEMFSLLLLAALAGSVILTYELLRSVWHTKSPTKVMYAMLLCLFVFAMALVTIFRFTM